MNSVELLVPTPWMPQFQVWSIHANLLGHRSGGNSCANSLPTLLILIKLAKYSNKWSVKTKCFAFFIRLISRHGLLLRYNQQFRVNMCILFRNMMFSIRLWLCFVCLIFQDLSFTGDFADDEHIATKELDIRSIFLIFGCMASCWKSALFLRPLRNTAD